MLGIEPRTLPLGSILVHQVASWESCLGLPSQGFRVAPPGLASEVFKKHNRSFGVPLRAEPANLSWLPCVPGLVPDCPHAGTESGFSDFLCTMPTRGPLKPGVMFHTA